jgi:hypothetical protein
MLRLIGILIGSALAIGLLIVTLGVPQFSNPASDHARQGGGLPATDPEAVTGDLPATESEAAEGELPAAGPEPVADDLSAAEPDAVTGELPVAEADTEALIDQIFSPDPQPALAGESESSLEPITGENWYAFWSPFRSELAANGFISKLQETTGIDYRVVKVKTGVYEVAFAYTDDADVEDKLSRISAATGLDMSGG